MEFGISAFLEKPVEKIQFLLKTDKNNCHFTWWRIYVHLWSYLAEFFLEWEMFRTKFVEKTKTYILCLISPPPCPRKSCRLWDNVEEYDIARQATDERITACAFYMLDT